MPPFPFGRINQIFLRFGIFPYSSLNPMAKTKVLITVKTYPSLSAKYEELVCTAGFLEDGSWIRIYPVPFRKIEFERQYKKYDWVEIDLVKNTSDFRPESYRPYSIDSEIKILDNINTGGNWSKRKEIVLNKVYTNLTELIAEAHNKQICTSLAVFKPSNIKSFKIESAEREWDEIKIAKIRANREQVNMFEFEEDPFEVVDKLPYKFSYLLEDSEGRESKMMIEDWEIGALFWNSLKRAEDDEKVAVEKVKQKYFDDFALTKDIYLYLGTTRNNHYVSRNPFVIIGTFTPKIETQFKLF